MKNLLTFSAFLAVFAGIVMLAGGIWGFVFTYKNVAQENIVTPSDASIPNAPVRGPFTLRAQAESIREHTLRMTGGKTFAEMPRTIPQTDEEGNPVLDEEGETVMVPNNAREIWITATTLTTALNLAIVTYAFSTLVILFGLISIWTGVVFFNLAKR